MITVDELFAEPFEPLWLTRKKQLQRESLEQAVTASTNFAYDRAAAESRKRIAARCDPRGNYSNGPMPRRRLPGLVHGAKRSYKNKVKRKDTGRRARHAQRGSAIIIS